jgi:hypothetical protein
MGGNILISHEYKIILQVFFPVLLRQQLGCSPSDTSCSRMVGTVAHMVGKKTAKGLVRKHERKRPLGRSEHRGEDNIKMDIK